MTEKELQVQETAIKDEGRVKQKSDLTLWQAVTMSIVAILAVAVGTIYGTVLF